MSVVPFRIVNVATQEGARATFLGAKEHYCRHLTGAQVAGAALFRHAAREAASARGSRQNVGLIPPVRPPERDLFEDTYALFTGGRALSENLQLDRPLVGAEAGAETVDAGAISGVTVRAFDWAPLIANVKPAPDPLAAKVPADQHAAFFPSIRALLDLADEFDATGGSLLYLAEPRAEDAGIVARYEQQLCLPRGFLAAKLAPLLVKSVALTGSDPYFRTGTDVALLMETADPKAVRVAVAARYALAAKAGSGAAADSGEVGGVPYSGVRSADRRVCSYVVALDRAVVVANSLAQLGRIVAAAQGRLPALAGLPEYTFFRTRYARGQEEETAFILLSDETIRRWCGPRWRIATSRRTRAAAALAELQAIHFDALVRGTATPAPLAATPETAGLGEVRRTPRGVCSAAYNTLDFLTPILEMPLAKVSASEAQSYHRWRNEYQGYWQRFFDPIAVRVARRAERLAADLTVMPLIAGSEYRDFMQFTQGARLRPNAGDPHDDMLLHLALALNLDNPMYREFSASARTSVPGLPTDPLEWFNGNLALYVEDDPFWDDLRRNAGSLERFFRKQAYRLPVALQFDVRNPLHLAGFVSAIRAFVEQSAPGLTTWTTVGTNDQAYVKVTARLEEGGAPPEVQEVVGKMALYYAATPRALTISLSEPVIRRALDRQRAARAADDAAPACEGDSVRLQASRKLVELAQALGARGYDEFMQRRSWGNLPILNELRRRYPERDPVALYREFWQATPVCPGGGAYVWNAAWHTMESTVYGHPGCPRMPSGLPPALASVRTGRFGLTFESAGLRAFAALYREAGTPPAKK
jgi:hypothetical protein